MIRISKEMFEKEVLGCSSKVFVVFTSARCSFCKNMEKMADTVQHELTDVKFCIVDTDKEPLLTKRFSISGVPTSIVFSEGRVIGRATGALTKAQVYGMLDRKPATV